MKEQVVSFEVAVIAKEKKFNWYTIAGYSDKERLFDLDDLDEGGEIMDNWNGYVTGDSCSISAPTQSLLQKWLREVHNIHIWIVPLSLNNYEYHYFKDTGWAFSNCGFKTYEEALEEGLKEGLKLIKV